MVFSEHLPAIRRSWPMAIIAVLAACATMQVGSDYDRGANFSGYHTFAMMRREHRGVHNPLIATRVDDAIRQELERKGYTLANDPSSADFTVDFTVGSRERTNVTSYPAPFAGAGWWGYRGWWGPYWGSNIDVRQYREGTLSIDMFDNQTHRPVWHGWAKKELSRKDMEQPEEPIRKAVASVLGKFPPSGASAS